MQVPPGLDLDELMVPSGLDGIGSTRVSPVDQAFDVALKAYQDGDHAAARAEWSELADAGHGLSAHNLAVMFWRGTGGERDLTHALVLFQEAAEAETAPSLHALGVLHLFGVGVEADPAEAVRLFETASGLGHTASTYNLAIAHLQGLGGANDPETGVTLLEAAAEADFARAQYDLGGLLYEGRFTLKDQAAARTWFERAAAQGDPFAMFNLGSMQLAGEGGPVEAEAGIAVISEAANAGVVPAQFRLAYHLASKPGATDSDREAALTWFLIAAAFDADGAVENAERLTATLSENSITKAQNAAKAFRPKSIMRQTP